MPNALQENSRRRFVILPVSFVKLETKWQKTSSFDRIKDEKKRLNFNKNENGEVDEQINSK